MKAVSEFLLSVNKPVFGCFHPFELSKSSNALSTLTYTVDSAELRLQISQKYPVKSIPFYALADGMTSLLLSSIEGICPAGIYPSPLGMEIFLSVGI